MYGSAALRISNIDYFDSMAISNFDPSGEGLVVGDNGFDLLGGRVCTLPSPLGFSSEINCSCCASNYG